MGIGYFSGSCAFLANAQFVLSICSQVAFGGRGVRKEAPHAHLGMTAKVPPRFYGKCGEGLEIAQ